MLHTSGPPSPPAPSTPGSPAYQVAAAALKAGMSLVPIRTDGTKQPALQSWKIYQQRPPTLHEIASWFTRSSSLGIALVTGYRNLEALDFDDSATYQAWRVLIQSDAVLSKLYEELAVGYEEVTPAGGRHLLYYCQEIAGNQKLAARPIAGPQGSKTLIETRGQGGLIIIDPSRGSVHPNGKPYLRVRGSVSTITTISPVARSLLLTSARLLDETPMSEIQAGGTHTMTDDAALQTLVQPTRVETTRLRPGDLYNELAQWAEVLEPYGWELVSTKNGEGFWRRPGKDVGCSATTNYKGSDRLCVFSTSTPFATGRWYSKFEAYTLLAHAGDFSAAARTLAEQGYTMHERHHNQEKRA